MFEIDGDALPCHGLDLPNPPFGPRWEAHTHAWFDDCCHGPGDHVASGRQRIPSVIRMQGMADLMALPLVVDPTLARMVGLRLCHDLGGVVGTVANALDMMEGVGGEAATLARDAADVLRRRLILWRALLGGQGEATLGATLALLEGQLAGGRALAEAGGLDHTAILPEPMIPVVLAAMLLGGESLPRGGRVCLAGDPIRELAVWPDGQRAAWPPALLRALGGEMPVDPIGREVIVVWLCAMAGAAGVRLSLAVPPGQAAGPLMLTLGD